MGPIWFRRTPRLTNQLWKFRHSVRNEALPMIYAAPRFDNSARLRENSNLGTLQNLAASNRQL